MGELLVFLPAGGAPPGYLEEAVSRASSAGVGLRGLYVVDAVWRRFADADWLSNESSRAGFEEYMRCTLRDEGVRLAEALAALAAPAGVPFEYDIVEGEPEVEFAAAAGRAGVKDVAAPPAFGRGRTRA